MRRVEPPAQHDHGDLASAYFQSVASELLDKVERRVADHIPAQQEGFERQKVLLLETETGMRRAAPINEIAAASLVTRCLCLAEDGAPATCRVVNASDEILDIQEPA